MKRTRLSQKGSDVHAGITVTIIDAAKRRGKTITAGAQLRINDILRKAEEAGVIRGEDESETSRVALSAAAIRAAEDEGMGRVTVRHLHKGWRNYYARTANCPPHLCLFRSVILMKPTLESSDIIFRQLAGLEEKE